MNDPKAKCGTCQHFRQFTNMPTGECYFLPPIIYISGSQHRPKVRSLELACGQHQPLPADTAPIEKGKSQVETPGAALKDARQQRAKR